MEQERLIKGSLVTKEMAEIKVARCTKGHVQSGGQRTAWARRKEGPSRPHHSFSFWHMPEDVRFGGGGCHDVTC